ncbi:MAG TPA: imidazole glycerol phosphate synthase subunit HisH [Vicinamibacterales bacterium]
MSIALVDYGAGNLTSVRKGLNAAGASLYTPASPDELASADGIIVPGVGHFGSTRAIDTAWRQAILDAAGAGTPLLGICLGLQYLFEGSTEAPDAPGLGILRGWCALLPPTRKVPHVGWNNLRVVRRSRLLADVRDGSQVYFTHSYAAPVTDACVAETEYTARFAAVVERQNVFGVQFHPEKSGDAGLRILRSFVQISRTATGQAVKC